MNKKRLPRTIVLTTLSLLELALPMKSELKSWIYCKVVAKNQASDGQAHIHAERSQLLNSSMKMISYGLDRLCPLVVAFLFRSLSLKVGGPYVTT
jgi:hypothetical protein